MHILVLGGSTAGASVVAQLRRRSEDCQITLIERSPHLATAYCGLAYAAGGIVRQDPDYLRPLRPEALAARFNTVVRTEHTALSIDRPNRRVTVRRPDGSLEDIAYDRLIYALGARSTIPRVPGAGTKPGVYALRDTEDLTRILSHFEQTQPRSAVIVGGGFIGLELAESLRHRGITVALIEQSPQLMAGKLDPDMARLLQGTLEANGVELLLNQRVVRLMSTSAGRTLVETSSGAVLEAGTVILAAGITPNVELAKEAGLLLGETGALRVDERMRTNDPAIYALGDVAEVACRVSQRPVHVPLAGPLARQAKVLAQNILGKGATYPGTLGTFVCKVFQRTVASTGISEDRLRQAGIPYHRLILPATNHVYFYPGVEPMFLKLLFYRDGRLLGAQAVGGEGTDKRIDVLATALAARMTVRDLEDLELAYAPPYGAPKDPVNLLGSLATARIDGDDSLLHPDDLSLPEFHDAQLVDIRSPEEFEANGLPGAAHIPAEALRERLGDLERDRAVILYCNSGAKGVSAQRLMAAAGFRCFNLMGGLQLLPSRSAARGTTSPSGDAAEQPALPAPGQATAELGDCDEELDLRGLVCPGPLVEARKQLKAAPPSKTIRILSTDLGFRDDFKRLARKLGVEVAGEGSLPAGAQWILVRTSDIGRDQ